MVPNCRPLSKHPVQEQQCQADQAEMDGAKPRMGHDWLQTFRVRLAQSMLDQLSRCDNDAGRRQQRQK
jgi:hypothetical protein